MDTLHQLSGIMKHFDVKQKATPDAVMSEIIKLLPAGDKEEKFVFLSTKENNDCRIFNHGCDYIVKHFDDEFDNAFDK
jgi:hypothetical protein